MTVLTTDLHVRRAGATDRGALADTLAEAFLDDPFMSWWMPDPQRRRRLLPAGFALIVDAYRPFDELYVTEPEPVACAVWMPAGRGLTEEQEEQLVTAMVGVVDEDADRLLCALERMAEHHPIEPHAYLFLLGTRARWQSRGLGTALLGEVLRRCDRDGTPAYLEATSPANRRLYLRHGFTVVGEIALPDGPPLWPMWRPPVSG